MPNPFTVATVLTLFVFATVNLYIGDVEVGLLCVVIAMLITIMSMLSDIRDKLKK